MQFAGGVNINATALPPSGITSMQGMNDYREQLAKLEQIRVLCKEAGNPAGMELPQIVVVGD